MDNTTNDDQDIQALTQHLDTLSKSVLALVFFTQTLSESHMRLTAICDMLAEKTGLTQDEVDAELAKRKLSKGLEDDGDNGAGGGSPDCWN